MQSACVLLYCHLWPVRLYNIFSHYLINGTILGAKLLYIKCIVWFSLHLSETFLVLRRIRRDIIINVHSSSSKVPAFLVGFLLNLDFLYRYSKNSQMSNLMKIRPVGAEFLQADRETDGHEAKSRLSRFCESA
jgi:hypothetical protein